MPIGHGSKRQWLMVRTRTCWEEHARATRYACFPSGFPVGLAYAPGERICPGAVTPRAGMPTAAESLVGFPFPYVGNAEGAVDYTALLEGFQHRLRVLRPDSMLKTHIDCIDLVLNFAGANLGVEIGLERGDLGGQKESRKERTAIIAIDVEVGFAVGWIGIPRHAKELIQTEWVRGTKD